tara:strand:- start:39 stop:695 length:657 start_codon:yes stop_codon:yes gene_type:complete
MGKKAQRRNERMITEATNAQLAEQRANQAQQRELLAAQTRQYREFEFRNPFEENVFEDLTVDQRAAQFQAEQGAQQRANIMSGLRGAAGSSGVAGLAQALAGQGTLQAQQMSASIGQQEAQNRKLAAQGAQMRQQGAAAVQAAEAGRESTLLGMQMGEMAGARAGMQAAFGNQMAGLGSIAQMTSARMGMVGDIVGGVIGGVAGAAVPGGAIANLTAS